MFIGVCVHARKMRVFLYLLADDKEETDPPDICTRCQFYMLCIMH